MQIMKEEYVLMSDTRIDFCQGAKTIRSDAFVPEDGDVAPSNRLRMDQTQTMELWNPLSSVEQMENSVYNDISDDAKYYN